MMIVLFYDSSAGFPNYTQPGPGPKLHNSQHQDSSWGQFSAEMIMKQTKVIMSSICLFSPHTGKKKAHIAQAPRQQFHFALNMYEHKCKLSEQVQKSFCRRRHPHHQKSDTVDDVSKMRASMGAY